jgi:hypothetical protein
MLKNASILHIFYEISLGSEQFKLLIIGLPTVAFCVNDGLLNRAIGKVGEGFGVVLL